MGECNAKAIQTNLDTFGYNQTRPRIIQAYLGLFRALCYPEIIKTVVYPKPWHIQNPRIFTTLVYSEPSFIQNAGIFKIWDIFKTLSHIYFDALFLFATTIIFTKYNYFRKACHVEINILRQFL